MDFTTGGLESGNVVITTLLIIALVAASLRARILDTQGVIAAALLGFFVGCLGHWTWLLLLLCFLLSSHVATKWRFEEKTQRGLNESSDGHRGWINVAANGGMPALVALLAFVLGDWEHGLWMFAAAVAVATSDTWASEIGCLDDRVRMITSFLLVLTTRICRWLNIAASNPGCRDSEDDLPLAAFCPRSSREDWPLGGQEIGQVASKSYWVVSDGDIRREFPGAICCRTERKASVWMTPPFSL